MRRWLPLLVVAAVGCADRAPAPVTPKEEVRTLSAQAVVTLAGERTDLGRVTEGRVALVSLWATWCDACTREIDSLNRLAARTADRHDAMVIGVAVGETREKTAEFATAAAAAGIAFPALVNAIARLALARARRPF